MDLQLLKLYLLSLIGTKYLYGTAEGGGDDPIFGFDCSGLLSEALRASGRVPHNWRSNAQGIYQLAKEKLWTSAGAKAELGDIAFYGKSLEEISHVAFCLDHYSMIEAGGGTPDTVTDISAASKNAFVRIRPIYYRRDFLCLAKPLYSAACPK